MNFWKISLAYASLCITNHHRPPQQATGLSAGFFSLSALPEKRGGECHEAVIKSMWARASFHFWNALLWVGVKIHHLGCSLSPNSVPNKKASIFGVRRHSGILGNRRCYPHFKLHFDPCEKREISAANLPHCHALTQ